MSEGGGSSKKLGPDTSGALATARTLPSDARIDAVASADTVLAVPAAEPSSPSQRGDLLGGRYRVLAEVGRGAEGVVYRARDLKADSIVALKLLQQDQGSDERLQRFRRELQMARKVTHPNVVRIYDLVELPGRFGLSMELVDGEPLDARIARGKLGREELVRLAVDLARALSAAHEAGVTHRDLKPGNVLLRRRDGHAVVTDFGVSRAHIEVDDDARVSSHPDPAVGPQPLALTREGALIGTPLYMSPEQLEGHADAGPAADVYAFGAVLYEAATGEPVHVADTIDDLLRLRNTEPAPALRDARPDLPRLLCDSVDRSLKRDARDRFPSGVELLAALEPLVTPARKGRGAPMWSMGLGLLAVGGAVAIFLRRPAPASPAARPPTVSPSTPPLAMHVSNARRITFGDACEEFPSFTPDGTALVYDGTVGRDSFIYLLGTTPGATPRQLTHVRGWDIAASVSPDGERIAFVRFEDEHVGAFVAPIDGHEAPHFVAKGAVRPSWTIDGTAIWAGAGDPLVAHDVATGASRSPWPGAPTVKSALSVELPDSSLLTVVPAPGATSVDLPGVMLLHADREPTWLFKGPLEEALAVTSDGQHGLVARVTSTGTELTDVPLDGSPPTSLASTGIAPFQGLALSRDGSRIVWSSCKEVHALAEVDARGKSLRTLRVDMAGVSSLAPVSNRSEIVVISSRAGRSEPWIVPLSGDTSPRAIGVGGMTAAGISVSHDGSRFVMSVPEHGLQIGSLDGDVKLRPLTAGVADSMPDFRFGDRQVVFTRRRADGKPQLMVVSVDGGAAEELMGAGSDGAASSPVDDRIAYLAGTAMSDVVPTLWDGRAGTVRPLSSKLGAGRYGFLRFSPDGRRVALVRAQTELLEIDVASGAIVRTLSTPTDDQLADPTYTPEGLVVVHVRWQGNLWMADVER